MYKLATANKKTEKRLLEYLNIRPDLKEKLNRLRLEPRKANEHMPCTADLKTNGVAGLVLISD